MASHRELYKPSGRVAWGRTAIWFVVAFPLTLLSIFALSTAFRFDIYVVILAGAVGVLPAVGGVWFALWLGHCRNSWVGAVIGLFTGIIALTGTYLLDFAREADLDQLQRFPDYVGERLKTDNVGPYGIRQRVPEGPNTGEIPVFLLDAFAMLSLPTAAGWVRARKPYSEKRRAWFYEHKITVSRDCAYALQAALDEGDVEGLVDAATPSTFDPVRGYGELRLSFIPYDPATPVYLTVGLTAGMLSWRVGSRTIVKPTLLTPEEAAALVDRVRPPGAKVTELLDAVAADVRPVRPGSMARVEELPEDQKASLRSGKWYNLLVLLNLAPLIVGLVFIIALAVVLIVCWSTLGTVGQVGIGAGIFAVLVGTLAIAARYADELPVRLQYRWYLDAIRQRPDAHFSPDDSDVHYVEIIPRRNWGKVMLNNAADVGFLKVDAKRRVLLYEGDGQRWSIPVGAIESCEMEEFCLGLPDPNERNLFAVAVLTANVEGELWEAPLLPARTTGRIPLGKVRRKWCRDLLKSIRRGLDFDEGRDR